MNYYTKLFNKLSDISIIGASILIYGTIFCPYITETNIINDTKYKIGYKNNYICCKQRYNKLSYYLWVHLKISFMIGITSIGIIIIRDKIINK